MGGRLAAVGLLGVLFVATGVLVRDSKAPSGPTRRVAVSGLSIEVPARWPRTSVPGEPCLDLTAPVVLVGTFSGVGNCYMRPSPTEPAVTFADGGPPEPPVPIGEPEARRVNGVAVLVTTADVFGGCRCGADGSEHEFMAVFPEWNAWLRVGMKADRQATLDAGNALLNTVRVSTGRDPAPPPPVRSFLGHWHVHGALLDIGAREARLTASCTTGPQQPCIETLTFAVSLSPDGRRLAAEMINDTWSDPDTGRPVPNPDASSDGSELGDTSYFEFVAPHLLKETYLRTAEPDFGDYGNPYWCGEDLDPSFDHCGL